jgi:hypothetical protein
LFVELLLLFGELSQHRGAVVGRDYTTHGLPVMIIACGDGFVASAALALRPSRIYSIRQVKIKLRNRKGNC